MVKIAVTGKISSGKSTVCQLFEELGAESVSADTIVHQLLENDPNIIHQVNGLLGETDKKIDRDHLAEVVFDDPEKLQALEIILHPQVMRQIASLQGDLIVAEVPLLYEGGFEALFSAVIVVDAPDEDCRQRYPRGDYKQRAARLMSQKEKMAKADFVINNSTTPTELRQQVLEVYQRIQK